MEKILAMELCQLSHNFDNPFKAFKILKNHDLNIFNTCDDTPSKYWHERICIKCKTSLDIICWLPGAHGRQYPLSCEECIIKNIIE